MSQWLVLYCGANPKVEEVSRRREGQTWGEAFEVNLSHARHKYLVDIHARGHCGNFGEAAEAAEDV